MSYAVNILKIQKILAETFTGIGKSVYINLVPSATTGRVGDYVVITTRSMVRDKGAYKRTYANISVVVKDRDNGRENSERIDEMTEAVLSKFPIVGDGFQAISPEVTYGGSMTGFSYATITTDLIIQ